ncbi:transcriptional regulator FilR1 domain-containing protein [Candidatus Halobonum tyrrellensis]|uniref:transcriptional regulator FilR1 domain-containing protein n=1 Tax=Candidatus Halobonum tyrrellensis TaxID=1431545 RepID=UPI0006780F2B|nr:helix-turn-helix domain-containing protein [Candidatus Halobonum tyrrellensis]
MGHEQVAFLAESVNRQRVLQHLRETGDAISISEFATEDSVSRATAHRALTSMADLNWLSQGDDGRYTLTATGHLVVRAHSAFLETADQELLSFLGGSSYRMDLLETLTVRDAQVKFQEMLVESEASKATVSRCMDDFLERDLIDRPDHGRYRLTEEGKQVSNAFRTLQNTVEWATENAPVVNALGSIGADLPIQALGSNTITTITASPADPDRAILGFTDRIKAADPNALYGVMPAASHSLITLYKGLAKANTQIELVVDDAVVSAAESSYPDTLSLVERCDELDLYEYPSRLDCGVAFYNDQAIIGVYHGDTGHLWAHLVSRHDEFTAWVWDYFDSHRKQATKFTARS